MAQYAITIFSGGVAICLDRVYFKFKSEKEEIKYETYNKYKNYLC